MLLEELLYPILHLLVLWTITWISPTRQERCRGKRSFSYYTLNENPIKITKADDLSECDEHCSGEKNCQSYSYSNVKKECKLFSQSQMSDENLLVPDPTSIYMDSASHICTRTSYPCFHKNQCNRNSTDPKGFSCNCSIVYIGERCENAIPITNCSDAIQLEGYKKDGIYLFTHGNESFKSVCKEDIPECGRGNWTQVITIDGKQSDLTYDSSKWTDKSVLNIQGGETESKKTPAYWTSPFTKMCIGMNVYGDYRWILINYTANSLYDVIAPGSYVAVNVTRDQWLALVPEAPQFPKTCSMGINNNHGLHKNRLGLIGNDDNSCSYLDSALGFGLHYPTRQNTCGGFRTFGGTQNVKAICYIYIA